MGSDWSGIVQQESAQLADDICTQIEKKRTRCPERDRNNIILLVDAIRSPAHTTQAVIAMLRQPPRSDYLASTGYREVWLAGANKDLTFRLDESKDGSGGSPSPSDTSAGWVVGASDVRELIALSSMVNGDSRPPAPLSACKDP